jgi:hypothetical protein
MKLARMTRAALGVTALIAVPAAAHAQFTVYTSLASYLAAVGANGTDTYTGFLITGLTPSPITRAAGAYSYTATAAGGFWGAGTTANPWLATNAASDVTTFNTFTPTVRAIGGNFFASDHSGAFKIGNINITATNAGGTFTWLLTAPAVTDFFGVVSTSAISSFTMSSVTSTNDRTWATADNLILAEARPSSVVPEPSTYLLMGTGLLSLAGIARRRNRRVS